MCVCTNKECPYYEAENKCPAAEGCVGFGGEEKKKANFAEEIAKQMKRE